MRNWLKSLFRRRNKAKLKAFLNTIDELNAESGGGPPTTIDAFLGTLPVPSRNLLLGDPQYIPSLELNGLPSGEVQFFARLWEYPSGQAAVLSLRMEFEDEPRSGVSRHFGKLPIDSAKFIMVDKGQFESHWTKTGKDRIGVISRARDTAFIEALQKRFKLRVQPVNAVRAEIVGPVLSLGASKPATCGRFKCRRGVKGDNR